MWCTGSIDPKEAGKQAVQRHTIAHLRYAGGEEHNVKYVSEVDYDRIAVRCDQLQQDLTMRDEEIDTLRTDLASAKADKEAYGQNAIDLRRRVENADLALKVQTQNCDTLRAQLAALLAAVSKHREALKPLGLPLGDRLEEAALSASADPSAPVEMQTLGTEFAQVLEENFHDLVLKGAPVESGEQAPCLNDWFLSLEPGRQSVLREDKWMLANAAFEAGLARAALERKA
jgi:hypothetical protein